MSDLTAPVDSAAEVVSAEQTVDEALAQELVERARTEGVELVGPGGLLTGLTKTVLETALEAELGEHLGYPKHAVDGRNTGNSRNGMSSTGPSTPFVAASRLGIPGRKQGHVDSSLDESLGEKRGELLPRPIGAWRHPPRDWSQHRDPHLVGYRRSSRHRRRA